MVALVAILPRVSPGQTRDSYEYSSEWTWGINKNTSGGFIGGFAFKHARRLGGRQFESFGLEIMNVKSQQEIRRSSPATGNFFIYGKTNYLYSFRFQYGRDFVLFQKAPQQGVEIKLVTAVGPSVGLLAPYYVEIPTDGFIGSATEPYDPSKTTHSFGNILGPGHLFEGVGQSNFKIGGNLKAALNFELGAIKSQVTGFEAGFLLDAYAGEVALMHNTSNPSVFPTAFVTLFYGGRK
jgi:hypothetical protein